MGVESRAKFLNEYLSFSPLPTKFLLFPLPHFPTTNQNYLFRHFLRYLRIHNKSIFLPYSGPSHTTEPRGSIPPDPLSSAMNSSIHFLYLKNRKQSYLSRVTLSLETVLVDRTCFTRNAVCSEARFFRFTTCSKFDARSHVVRLSK